MGILQYPIIKNKKKILKGEERKGEKKVEDLELHTNFIVQMSIIYQFDFKNKNKFN